MSSLDEGVRTVRLTLLVVTKGAVRSGSASIRRKWRIIIIRREKNKARNHFGPDLSQRAPTYAAAPNLRCPHHGMLQRLLALPSASASASASAAAPT